MLQMKSA